jgi:hypothetical protein
MRILIANAHVPFQRDDATARADDLCQAFRAAGHDAEVFAVPFNLRAPERLLDQMLACRLLDVSEVAGERVDLLVGLRFPAYHVAHPNKVLWLADEQLSDDDLADNAHDDPRSQTDDARARDAIRRADCDAVREAKKIFTVSRRVSVRLKESCGVDSTPLQHPPPRAGEFSRDAARARVVSAPDESLEISWSLVVRELLR